MKSVVENGMEAEIYGLAMVVRILVEMRFWLGDLLLEAPAWQVGATTQDKFSL
jgi:hypothetical protein